MARPVTLCTGQWADMPLEELAMKASEWGFDGLELACWGKHFNTQRALNEPDYLPWLRGVLEKNNLKCWALAAHLVGQAVCDNIDARHKGVVPDHVWGDGDPEGVRQRAAKEIMDTVRAGATSRATWSATAGAPAHSTWARRAAANDRSSRKRIFAGAPSPSRL